MKKRTQYLAALLLVGFAGACSKAPAPNMAENIRVEKQELTVTKETSAQLARINEANPSANLQVWLNKDFWIGKTIWVSIGVERASVTGLAMSVDGYHAAKLSIAGSYLVLTRDSTGLFGGTVFAPDIALNAYPIVAESASEILVDLAAPKTPYGLTLSNMNAGTYSDTELSPRFEYVRSVETSASSVSFTSVTTVKSPTALYKTGDTTPEAISEQDPFLLSMTLRTDWILPIENTGFTAKRSDDSVMGFFLTPKRISDNGLSTTQYVQKIATNKPFVWELSSNTPEEYRPAIEQGILAWNSGLGGDVLQVTYGSEMGSVTKNNVSNLVWDDNMAVGFAFANWRSNPSTGEIVQAQVYLSGSMWAQGARVDFQLREIDRQIRESSTAARSSAPGSKARQIAKANLKKAQAELGELARETSKLSGKAFNKRFFIGLNSSMAAARARSNEYCLRPLDFEQTLATILAIDSELDDALRDLDRETQPERQPDIVETEHDFPTHLPWTPAGLDMETFSKYVVRSVVMHEVGHALGLRHNFMGSLGTSKNDEIQSASIMDYNDLVIDAQFDEIGSTDRVILESEYLNKPIVEQVSYCTDEHAAAGLPTCAAFDFSANPLRGQQVVEESYLTIAQAFMQFEQYDMAMQLILRSLRSNVLKIRHSLFSAELASQVLQDPAFGDSQKEAWNLIKQSMTMQGTGYPESFVQTYKEALVSQIAQLTTPDTASSAVAADLVEFYKELLINADNKNSLQARRFAVNGLQGIQTDAGRNAMAEAYTGLAQKIQSPLGTGADQEALLVLRKILLQDGYFKVAAAN